VLSKGGRGEHRGDRVAAPPGGPYNSENAMEQSAVYKPPLSERINVRMIVFAAVVLLLVGYPVYVYVESMVTHGVRDVGNGYKQVDLKAMSSFPFDQSNGTIDDIPQIWRDLDGKKVILYGEMWNPTSAGDKLGTFELVYSIAKCCFNGPPQIQHFVQSKVVDDGKADYYDGLVKVTGTLHVDVKKAGGKVVSVYQLYVDSVEPSS
jgi:hypothetical protein